ncbi:hypothetical protein VFPFJ_03197 [Purpureocillium lilacinum]|uniref:Uncharacterized protein n=1 Tax=Purpureocillium lilacinum TaxID=33203 RepID=A0A179HMC1_PURLI|nr:hypothetical protein VFPFJ_03197 [Purpureocillium lilacinum]OAQ91457.1 hypothetical protein VFPFJ_03197 [Purpureocillium lilacinum]
MRTCSQTRQPWPVPSSHWTPRAGTQRERSTRPRFFAPAPSLRSSEMSSSK